MGIPYLRFGTPKLVDSKGIEGFPPRTPLSQNLGRPQIRAPLLTDLGGESQGKEQQRVHAYIPHQIPKRKVSKPPQKNCQKRLRKSPKRENGRDTIKP
jgi:hypothetical protein